MVEPYEAIIRLLDEAHSNYELLAHEPVFTSEQAAAVRGLKLEQGAKSLLFKLKDGSFVVVVVPGNKQVDSKKLKSYTHSKSLRFATPEEVVERMGCQIGACYPLGVVADLRTIVDTSLGRNTIISFNPGRHDVSVTLAYKEYLQIAQAETAQIAA